MRRLAALSLLLPVIACAEVPTAEELAVAEPDPVDDASVAAIPGSAAEASSSVPTPVEVAPANTSPRLRVSKYDGAFDEPMEYADADGTARCPFTVEAEGFPAVSTDGRTVAYAIAETLSSSDGEDELVTVHWLDVASDTEHREVVVDGQALWGPRHCQRLWVHARRRVDAINTALASSGWRAMPQVDIAIPEGPWADDSFDPSDGAASEPPPRRVELVRRGADAVVRIPGVRVLGRRPAEWDAPSDEACVFVGYATAVHADAQTGVAVARVEQYAPPCFCYADTTLHPIALPREILATLGGTGERLAYRAP